MIDSTSLSLGIFGCGVLLESLRHARSSYVVRVISACLIVSLLVLWPGNSEMPYDVGFHFGFYIITFSFLYATFAAKDILPVITERVILQDTILFWYIILLYSALWLIIPIGIVSMIVLYSALTNFKVGFTLKIILYIWFLLMNLSFLISQFTINNIFEVITFSNGTGLNYLNQFFSGMVFLDLMVSLTALFNIIPLARDDYIYDSRIDKFINHTKMLAGKFSDQQIKISHAVILFILQGGLLLVNFFYNFLPQTILINAIIILSTNVTIKKRIMFI